MGSVSGLSSHMPHVLAVDDNLVDRKLVEKLLTKLSCRVTTAENAAKALEYLAGSTDDNQVNLIITDYCMPDMTGYELLKIIKGNSYLKNIPVVVVSSENSPNRINRCMEEGAHMFFVKPLKLSDIKKLRRFLMVHLPCPHRD